MLPASPVVFGPKTFAQHGCECVSIVSAGFSWKGM